MGDVEKARQLFRDAGLPFPTIPHELAAHLKEQGRWLFSTRPIEVSPYDLGHYLDEADGTHVKDYAVLSHSGHGVNSYAIQYYIVRGSLHMFLHLGWGGVYTDAKRAAAQIRNCFSVADEIVAAAEEVGDLNARERLTVVGSDFCGSYWLPPWGSERGKHARREGFSDLKPLDALTEALGWLTSYLKPSNGGTTMPIPRNRSTTNGMPTLFEDSVELIRTGARELGPSFGWEFLYCPPSLLSKRSLLWFIGINPGIDPKEESGKVVPCFENGNAYYVDEPWSPDGERLRNQVKEFFNVLAGALEGKQLSGEGLLNETLTANFCPFSSGTWRTLPERRKAVNLSRELWSRILRHLSPRVIICMGGMPYREFRRLYREMDYEFSKETTKVTGWGAVNFRLVDCHKNGRLTRIVYLPHFSQIKLMLHKDSLPHVKRICVAIAESLYCP